MGSPCCCYDKRTVVAVETAKHARCAMKVPSALFELPDRFNVTRCKVESIVIVHNLQCTFFRPHVNTPFAFFGEVGYTLARNHLVPFPPSSMGLL